MSTAKPPTKPLEKYVAKRNFTNTPEPSGAAAKTKPAAGKRLRFVVQMHRATRLHWDFRLEADGVLKSWAIPKGPTLDSGEKRLAMHVEDHPLDYRDFEGIIPKGNYGAGEVIVWDRGTYRLLEGTDTTAQIAKGSLKFELFGKKLHGGFALVHIKKARDGEENAWLLIKERDDWSDPDWKVEDHSESVKSGRTLADLAKDPKAPHWISNRPESAAKPRAPAKQAAAKLPSDLQTMLATPVDEPFDDKNWLFELKWDGYRALATIARDGTLTLRLAQRQRSDGEISRVCELGRRLFRTAAHPRRRDRRARRRGTPVVSAFAGAARPFRTQRAGEVAGDVRGLRLLYANGRDVRKEPLEKRKAMLESLLLEKVR